MATCKICGKEDHSLPPEWINWECPQCETDLWRTQDNPHGFKPFVGNLRVANYDFKVSRQASKERELGYYDPDDEVWSKSFGERLEDGSAGHEDAYGDAESLE